MRALKNWAERNKLVTVLVILLFAAGIFYLLFAHQIIEAIYKGNSLDFFNNILQGKEENSLDFYLRKADNFYLRANILFIVLILTLYFCLNLKVLLKNYYFFASLFLVGLTTALLIFALKTYPISQGDGYEYSLILQAFYNHFTPDIRLRDIQSLKEIIDEYPISLYAQERLQIIANGIQNHAEIPFVGIYRSDKGMYFFYHFWFYSLVNVPAKIFLSLFNLNPLKAFQVTNALLITAATTYLLLLSKQPLFTKFTLTIFFLLGCNIFYLQWPHPEVYTASLLIISTCALVDDRYSLAILMSSLAALQNPSVVLIGSLVIITFILKNYGWQPKILLEKKVIRQIINLSLLVAIGLIPYIFYYYHFGTFNLIVASGFINKSLIGLPRFTSMIFDLNQGIIVGFPGILGGIIFLLIWRLYSCFLTRKYLIFDWSDVLIVASILIIIPTLAQTNWNSGQAFLNRYAVWVTVPLLTWLAVNLTKLSQQLRLWLTSIIILFQLIPHLAYLKTPWKFQYLSLKPHAEWVLNNLPPGWYKPDPEIFAERVRKSEHLEQQITPNPKDAPYIYVSNKGDIKQILLYRDSITKTGAKICGQDGSLINLKTEKPVNLANVTFDRRGWGYLTGYFRCSLPISIDFSETGNSSNFIARGRGWSKPDSLGREINKSEAEIKIPLLHKSDRAIAMTTIIHGLIEEDLSKQKVEVIVNGKTMAKWVLIPQKQIYQYQIIIPAKLIEDSSWLKITFKLLDSQKSESKSPKHKFINLTLK
jgi:hypothetical protein